jgi:hypothetical protein
MEYHLHIVECKHFFVNIINLKKYYKRYKMYTV